MLLIDVFLICSCFPQLLNSNPSKLGFQGFFSLLLFVSFPQLSHRQPGLKDREAEQRLDSWHRLCSCFLSQLCE